LKALIENLKRHIAADDCFVQDFNAQFTGKTIVIKPAADPESVKNYYDASFTADGKLQIVYRSVWTNISNLGQDIPSCFSVNGIPYVVVRSIRKYGQVLEDNLNCLESVLHCSDDLHLEPCVLENCLAMTNAGYDLERFGEIFFVEHLSALLANVQQQVAADNTFANEFLKYCSSRTIVIRPAADPASVEDYYDSSFTVDGKLLIEYRSLWTNIDRIGADLATILREHDDDDDDDAATQQPTKKRRKPVLAAASMHHAQKVVEATAQKAGREVKNIGRKLKRLF
jgi:hypothetical protein